MASSVEDRLEKNLECGICLESFQKPRMLRCHHTYCEHCLQRIVFRAAGGRKQKITCPECRVETKLQQGGVENLPSNFLIKQLLEVNNDAQLDAQVNCEKHAEEPVDLYCSCDKPICRACTVIDHRSHLNQPLSAVFSREKKKIGKLLEEAKPQMSALKAEITSIEGIEEALPQNFLEVKKQVDSFIDSKISQLDSARERLKEEVNEMSTALVNDLKEKREALLLSVSKVENVKESFTSCSHSGEKKVEFLRKRGQFEEHLRDLSSISHDIRPCKKVSLQLLKIHPVNSGSDLQNQARIRRIEFSEYEKPPSLSTDDVILPKIRIEFALVLLVVGLLIGFLLGQKVKVH